MQIFNYILLTILGLAPSVTWLIFYLREDANHPEPRKLLLYTFLSGAVITLMVLQIQLIVNRWLVNSGVDGYGSLSFLMLAIVEEFFKFLAVYLVIRYRPEFDEPVDAMIYMIVGALGFAAVENVASVFQATGAFFPKPGPLETTILRFVGATLLHTLASGFVGYQWGVAKAEGRDPKFNIFVGLAGATLLHAIFNYLIIKSGPVTLPIVLLVLVAPFLLNDFEKLKHLWTKK